MVALCHSGQVQISSPLQGATACSLMFLRPSGSFPRPLQLRNDGGSKALVNVGIHIRRIHRHENPSALEAWLIIVASAIAVPLSAFGEVPQLNSDWGAPRIIYLDLTATSSRHRLTAARRRSPQHPRAGPSISKRATSRAASLLRRSARSWGAVAEDFAPFNVNVTTDPRKEPSPDTPNAIRVCDRRRAEGRGRLGVAPARVVTIRSPIRPI